MMIGAFQRRERWRAQLLAQELAPILTATMSESLAVVIASMPQQSAPAKPRQVVSKLAGFITPTKFGPGGE